ncbi:hypothetical protein F53441_1725, partial [Fusarium austroafricanum]
MLSHLLIIAFFVAAALGQTSCEEQFKYWGCATVDAAGFTGPVPLPNGILTPETCQAACAGHMFAAVSPDACRCGDDPNAIKSVDEHSCNYPCSQDPNSPMCGGICPEGTPSISNLFIVEPAMLQASDPVIQPGNPLNQPVTANAAPPAPEVSFASDALPWATSAPPPGPPPPPPPPPPQSAPVQAPPLSTDAVQPPQVTSVNPPLATSVPVDPPVTSPSQPVQTPPDSTTGLPSPLPLSEDPEWELSGTLSGSQAEPSTSEIL